MSNTKLDVRVYPIEEPNGSTVAFASVAVDDMVAIRGIRVVSGDKGLFVSMPQSRAGAGEYHDIAFPLTADLRRSITAAVLGEYDRIAVLTPEQRGYAAPEAGAASMKCAGDVKLDIRIYPLREPNDTGKAFASVSMNGLIAIRGIRVVEGEKGIFTSMPQSRDREGGYHDIAFPLSADLRRELSGAVVAAYREAVKKADKSLSDGLKRGAERAAGQAEPNRDATDARGAEAIGA